MQNNKQEKLESEKEQFRESLDRILDTSLTVDNVNGYAERMTHFR